MHDLTECMMYDLQEDMKNMPRVATFLKNIMNYHTTYPTEKEAKEAKKQPKVTCHEINATMSPSSYATIPRMFLLSGCYTSRDFCHCVTCILKNVTLFLYFPFNKHLLAACAI